MAEACMGCDTIFHTNFLRDYRNNFLHWKQLYDLNVVGSWNVIVVAIMCGVKKIIMTSDIRSAIVSKQNNQNNQKNEETITINEENSLTLESLGLFGKSMKLAEQAILSMN